MTYTSYTDKIEGWMTDPELQFLYDTAERDRFTVPGGLLEIGCWQGLSTSALLQVDDVDVIDTFTGTGSMTTFADSLQGKPREWLYGVFTTNMAMMPGYCIIHMGPSNTRLRELLIEGRRFRMIFVDGGHEYEVVKDDFAMSKKLLSPHGIIIFDDYNDSWPGVKKAADEEFDNITRFDNKVAFYHA